jgi:cation:H+ antiporter
MSAFPQSELLGLFLAATAVVWIAGIHLSRSTAALDDAFGWGQATGGMVLLALVTNLPEMAIVSSAAFGGHIELAVGNILGGIAIQTVVLVVFDAFGNRGHVPLATRADSSQLPLEGLLVIGVLAIVLLGHFMPKNLILLRVTPDGALIATVWLATLMLLSRLRAQAASKSPKPVGTRKRGDIAGPAAVFGLAALATLAAGVTLEIAGDALAQLWQMQGAIFGATALAAATALPEVATGLPAVQRKEYTLAVSDIFGGNAFLPVLFLVATLISGQPVLPAAQPSDLYLTALAILLTAIYVGAMLVKPTRKHWGLGPESWLLLASYLAGIAGLFMVAQRAH